MHPNDNLAPYKYVYLLKVDDSWVMEFGYVCGAGTWMQAKDFRNYKNAKIAKNNPQWHNDPQGISRAKIVRLTITISEIKIF